METRSDIKLVLKDMKKSFSHMTNHLGLSFTIAVLDAFFVVMTSFILGLFFQSIYRDAGRLIEFFVKSQDGVPKEELVSIIPSQQAFYSILGSMFLNATLFFVILCIVWTLIQGLIWHMTYRISEHEKGPKIWNYMRRFAKSNILIGLVTYIALCVFLVIIMTPLYSQSVNGSIMMVSILGILAQAYLIVLGLAFVIITSVIYSAIFTKKSFSRYREEVISIVLSRKILPFIGITMMTIVALVVADLAQKAFHVLPEKSMIVWIDPSIVIGFILVFGILVMYRLVMLKTFERLLKGNKKKK
ncbi:MAG: hypothetical protein ACLFTR_02505 [Candidatus Woesearchaeota archaeon]